MANIYIKPKAFYDSFEDVNPSQPMVYDYADRPTFTFHFLPSTIAVGDTLVFAVDNDMVFFDSTPENILHSATCMVVVKHTVTSEDVVAGTVTMQIETRTVKFRDTVNGKVRPLDVVSGLYRLRGTDENATYSLLAKARAFANGIIADYDSLPEPITTDEYYTKDEIDGKLEQKADEADLTAHTNDTAIHVTVADKTAWDSKADISDIPTNVSELTNDADYQSGEQVSSSISTAIADKADRSELPTKTSDLTNDSDYQTGTQVDSAIATAIADKADKASTLSGYGIVDAYTKTEVDNKIASVFRYKGTVNTYADLPASGMEVGDVWNVVTADSTHGIKAGDNLAWNGSTWDALAGEIDLSAYATKTELATKMDEPDVAGTVGQVLTKTATGQKWTDTKEKTDWLCFTAAQANSTIHLDKTGYPLGITLETSTDGETWTAYTWNGNTGATITLANVGDKVFWRGDNNTFTSNTANRYQYVMTGYINASGNIMSLLRKDCSLTEFAMYDQRFQYLFGDCASLLTAPKLPATKLGYHTYNHCFYNTSISKVPELPATYFLDSCYANMFDGCTGLTTVPTLPYTGTIPCCWGMYANCTGLASVEVPEFMYMGNDHLKSAFYGCTNLRYVKVGFHSFNSATTDWLDGVSSTGTFICPSDLEITSRSVSTVPAGWKITRADAVQSDWSASSTSPAFIANKPDINQMIADALTLHNN